MTRLVIYLSFIHNSIGDADFYPGGLSNPVPPGCFSISCAHYRAPEYYAESVYPGNEFNFMGVKCSSLDALNGNYCHGTSGKIFTIFLYFNILKKFYHLFFFLFQSVPMGYATPSYLKGNFFLKINDKSPFGLNAIKDHKPICRG